MITKKNYSLTSAQVVRYYRTLNFSVAISVLAESKKKPKESRAKKSQSRVETTSIFADDCLLVWKFARNESRHRHSSVRIFPRSDSNTRCFFMYRTVRVLIRWRTKNDNPCTVHTCVLTVEFPLNVFSLYTATSVVKNTVKKFLNRDTNTPTADVHLEFHLKCFRNNCSRTDIISYLDTKSNVFFFILQNFFLSFMKRFLLGDRDDFEVTLWKRT